MLTPEEFELFHNRNFLLTLKGQLIEQRTTYVNYLRSGPKLENFVENHMEKEIGAFYKPLRIILIGWNPVSENAICMLWDEIDNLNQQIEWLSSAILWNTGILIPRINTDLILAENADLLENPAE